MTIEAAAKAGVRTVIVGVANRGGILPDHWLDMLVKALDLGMDLASGLHKRLTDFPRLVEAAGKNGRRLFRSEEHTSELQSLMRISYAVFCLNQKHMKTQIKN